MEIPGKGQTVNVGLSANNILGQGWDAQVAYSLLLWRTHGVLKSPKHGRETMPEFEENWELLQQARLKNAVTLARDRTADKGIPSTSSSADGNNVSGERTTSCGAGASVAMLRHERA